jgi:hypothetical protein
MELGDIRKAGASARKFGKNRLKQRISYVYMSKFHQNKKVRLLCGGFLDIRAGGKGFLGFFSEEIFAAMLRKNFFAHFDSTTTKALKIFISKEAGKGWRVGN